MNERTIVVGVDETDAARAALRWAVRHARDVGGTVAAVAVWQQPPMLAAGTAEMIAPVVDDAELEADARRWVSDAVAELPAGAAELVEGRVVQGDPKEVLLDQARGAAMLVLGNHRHGRVAGALLGSVALSCAHHADCPVVLVPG